LTVVKVTQRFRAKLRQALRQAEAGAGGGTRVHVEIILRSLCACGPGSVGRVTADPPGLTASKNDETVRTSYGYTLPAGTTVEIEAEPKPGYYLSALNGACVYRRPGRPDTRVERLGRARTHGGECTIVPVAEGGRYEIGASADFLKCPPNPEAYPADKFPLLREDCLGHR
jgi:hypothetical protein